MNCVDTDATAPLSISAEQTLLREDAQGFVLKDVSYR